MLPRRFRTILACLPLLASVGCLSPHRSLEPTADWREAARQEPPATNELAHLEESVEIIGPRRKSLVAEMTLQSFEIKAGRLEIRPGEKAIPTPTSHPEALNRGDEALKRGDKLGALTGFAEAVLAAPDDPRAYFPLARVLRRLGRPLFAEAALRKRLDMLSPRPLAELPGAVGETLSVQKELAALLAALGRRDEAAEIYRTILRSSPEDGQAHARLAVELYYLGQDADARASLEAARFHGGRIPGALPALLSEPIAAATRQTPAATGSSFTLSPPVRLDSGGAAQAVETSISGRGPHLVAGWNDQRQGPVSGVWRLGAAISQDGGATWSETLLRPPAAMDSDFEGDPMSAFDPRTGDTWVGGVTFSQGGGLYAARKRSGNAFFDAAVAINDNPDLFYDKPLMTAGPGPGAPLSTRLYVAFSEGLQSSGDLGATWSSLLPLGEPFVEVIYQPRVDAAGVLSIVSWDSAENIWLRRSLNGGSTVGARQLVATRLDVWGLQESSRVPGQFRAPPLPSLAVAEDGTLYVVYADTTSVVGPNSNLDLYFTSSTNGGANWSTPVVINGDDDPPGDQFAPWIEVDSTGRLHVVFFDSRYNVQNDTDPTGLIDVTYAFSDDGGASWQETRVTPTSSSSADAIWVGGPGVADYQFFGDYLGLSVKDDGEAVVVYPAVSGGDLDIYSRRIQTSLFTDGFESGTLGAWSSSVGD